MTKTSLCLLLLLGVLSTLTRAEDIQKVYAGIITSFKKDFVDEYKNTLNSQFIDQFTRLNFPTVENTNSLSIFEIWYKISNIKVLETSYNP